MSANPRKFSEKIALQQQKQAEGTAAYEQIMREVTATTRLAVVKPMQPKQDAPTEHQSNPNGMLIKESDSGNSINLKNALMNLEDIKHSIEKPSSSYSPNLVSVMSHGSVMGSHSREQSPMRQFHPQQHSKRKKFSAERHREFSPYASPHLLALDPGWRRVSSDSAIHAGVQSGGDYAQKGSATVKEAKNSGGTAAHSTALFIDRHLRPRSCEMAGLNTNGFTTTVPQQVASYDNTLCIPAQTNNNSASLPNIKNSALQATNLVHSMANYLEDARCNQQMTGQPLAYLPTGVGSGGGDGLVVQSGGTIYLGNVPQHGSYVGSLYGGSQVPSHVGSMPTQNGHFLVHQQNAVPPPSNLAANQVIGYQEVAPPPYPYPKSSSLPPTSPPPSITLTDVECPGRPLETILMESPAMVDNMYSPSWDRFLQSPGFKVTSPNLFYANSPQQVQTPDRQRVADSSPTPVYLMSQGRQPGLQLVGSTFSAQMVPMNSTNGNQWSGHVGNSNNSNINNNNNDVKLQNVTSNSNSTLLGSSFRDPSVHPSIVVKNEPPPPYESLASQGTLPEPAKNSGHNFLIDENLSFLDQSLKRNPLQRQDAQVALPSDLEDFPSLSCLGDSFEDVELMNAGDLLEPLDIEDLNLLSSGTCTVPDEEFFSLDKNC